ncbi:MAG: hypothetical protein V2I43_05855 [Parvularcula sp.]|jgi:hypothetical protein|nr:hypothetical protein [Parvularcula sp.]
MKKRFLIAAGLAAWAPAYASPIVFEEDFQGEDGNGSLGQFEVVQGEVELVDDMMPMCAAGNVCLNLDGNGSENAVIQSTEIQLEDDTQYRFSFDFNATEGMTDIEDFNVQIADYVNADVVQIDPNAEGFTVNFVFTATSSELVRIVFTDLIAPTDGVGVVLDNIRLVETPLPGAALLFGSAAFGIGALRRRRAKA